MSEISAGQARVSMRPDGIVAVIAENSREHTADEAAAVMDAVGKLLGGRRVPLLLNMVGAGGLTTEARDYYNARAPSLVTAVGIVTTSVVGRVIANFFIALNVGVLPVRLFSDERSAVSWLGGHKAA